MAIWLNKDDVASVITVKEAIPAVESAFRQLAEGKVVMPQRVGFKGDGGGGAAMPAFVGGPGGGLGVKVVALFGGNAARGLPVVNATMLLLEANSGRLLAVMDAGYLTAVRTGAVGGVAAKHLSREDARVATVFGAGIQARTQLEALVVVRGIERVFVIDTVPDAAHRFAEEMSRKLNATVEVAGDVQSAVRNADIVVTATTAHEPIFDGAWLKPGTHINGIGSHAPAWRELDGVAVKRSTVVVDQFEACMAEAGDLILAMEENQVSEPDLRTELGDVITGSRAGRSHADEITLFKSVGLAIQDIATAARVYDLAMARGVGQELEGTNAS